MSWSIHCDRCGVTHCMAPADGDLPRYWREIDGKHYCGGGRWGNGCAKKKTREGKLGVCSTCGLWNCEKHTYGDHRKRREAR
jgi:hypothetical protein